MTERSKATVGLAQSSGRCVFCRRPLSQKGSSVDFMNFETFGSRDTKCSWLIWYLNQDCVCQNAAHWRTVKLRSQRHVPRFFACRSCQLPWIVVHFVGMSQAWCMILHQNVKNTSLGVKNPFEAEKNVFTCLWRKYVFSHCFLDRKGICKAIVSCWVHSLQDSCGYGQLRASSFVFFLLCPFLSEEYACWIKCVKSFNLTCWNAMRCQCVWYTQYTYSYIDIYLEWV